VREKRITVSQNEISDDLEITAASEEHRKTFAGASLQISEPASQSDEGLDASQA